MLIMTCVTLYTSRVVLENLGVEDFGIFSVVGGVAVIFSFFNNALSASTQRYITVSLGKEDIEESRKVFSMSVNCHLLICIIILILSETIGLWFMNYKLNIPTDRMVDANWVYQFSLLSCLLGVLMVPYTGCIIAYEKMSFFAFTSVISAFLKLAIAWMIMYHNGDRLILYSSLLALSSFLITGINYVYCKMNFDICRYVRSRSKALFKSMLSFTGWNLFKTGAIIGVSQGNNIIVNIFGGPYASAAMAIANQVNGTIYSFMQNVQTAFNPQITKNIASGNNLESMKLVSLCSRFSFILLSIAGIPLILQMNPVLHLWLKEVPESTSMLCILSIVSVAFDALTGPLTTAVFAKGNIRNYQIVTSILWALAIPFAWFILKIGVEFKFILISKIIAQLLILLYSLIYVQKEFGLKVGYFLEWQFIRPLLVVSVILLLGFQLIQLLNFHSIINILFTVIYSTISMGVSFYLIALSSNERIYITRFLKSKITCLR